MIVSYNWLKEFIDIECSVSELADKITMAGLEVDSVKKIETYDAVIGQIAKITSKNGLNIYKVDTGNGFTEIVSTGKRLNVNDKIAFVENGKKFKDTIIKSKEFGEFKSNGVILSAYDFGMDAPSDEGLVLEETAKNGAKLNSIDEFNDYLIEIEFTPNRADALSILGVARDIKALTKKELKYPNKDFKTNGKKIEDIISAKIENYANCPRYTLAAVDIKVKPSPFFIKMRLLKSGIRPINNIVDITNYVLMAFGQPMHAFDADKIDGSITIRNAQIQEKITALDSKEYELDEDMLVISDDKKAIAIAGVMGGEESSISDKTTTILLESAHFNPTSVRLTARKLKLHTEASHRFERGVDPNLCIDATSYALKLLSLYADAKIYEGIIDLKEHSFESKKIICKYSGINKLLGSNFNKDEIFEVMQNLQFKPQNQDNDSFIVYAPTYRFDMENEADVAEEVARIMGYGNITATMPVVSVSFKEENKINSYQKRVAEALSYMGMFEVINYSFTESSRLKLFDKDEDKFVYLKNPLIENQSVMRTTIACGLMDNLVFNINKGAKTVPIFEFGRVFFKDKDYVKESYKIGFLMWGNTPLNWFEKERFYDFYDIKGVSEAIAGISNSSFIYKRSEKEFLHPKRSADLFLQNENLGYIGELHPDLYEVFGIKFDRKKRILIGELSAGCLIERLNNINMYKKIPKIPTVTRDLAVVADKDIDVQDIISTIKNNENIYSATLFDVYDQLKEKNKKSLAFRLILKNNSDSTFKDTEIDEIVNSVYNEIENKFNVKLRG